MISKSREYKHLASLLVEYPRRLSSKNIT